MPAVAALLDGRSALLALRRTLDTPVVACRSAVGLGRLFGRRVLDAVVLGIKALGLVDLVRLGERYPRIPILLYGGFRPGHGALLTGLLAERRIAGLLVEGVDDPVAGDLVRRVTATRAREIALRDAPRLLRLTEPIQRRAWDRVLAAGGGPIRVADVARSLAVSREHLSRQFGAGGAPTLKRVIDLLRVASAAQLLGNPGYDAAAAARILGFASPSHLNAMTRRVTGEPTSRLGTLGPRGALAAFLGRSVESPTDGHRLGKALRANASHRNLYTTSRS